MPRSAWRPPGEQAGRTDAGAAGLLPPGCSRMASDRGRPALDNPVVVPGRVPRSRVSRLPRPGRLLRTAATARVSLAGLANQLVLVSLPCPAAGTAFGAAPIDVHVAGSACCLAVCSRWASRDCGMRVAGATEI